MATVCPTTFTPSDDACPHCWDEATLKEPRAGADKVHKDECAYCHRTACHGEGIYVCTCCFQGMCGEHVAKHVAVTGHAMYCVVKKEIPRAPTEAPTELAQVGLEAAASYEEPRLVCVPCQQELVMGVGLTAECVMGIVAALSPQKEEAINLNAWGNAVACSHCEGMVQDAEPAFSASKPPAAGEPCTVDGCGVTANNWMCLTCGAIGCPRAEAGGKQHAINHFLLTGHPVVVKIGTVTAAGADLYCYACDDEVKDSKLAAHLAYLGVNMATAVKTSKSLGEMMLDQSLKHDYSAITEDGRDLVKVHGPGYTGLINFGNSCYMASVLQCLFAAPAFQERYFSGPAAEHIAGCTSKQPTACYGCQAQRLAHGMLSGRFSAERADADEGNALNGITPRDFKAIVANGHYEYSTAEQQDAAAFLLHLLEQMARRELALGAAPSPTRALQFVAESRSECQACRGVRYSHQTESALRVNVPVQPMAQLYDAQGAPRPPTEMELAAGRPQSSLRACFESYVAPSDGECRCDGCGALAVRTTTSRLATFPDVLAVNVNRTYLDKTTYEGKKLDVFVEADDALDAELLRGRGPQEGEKLFAPEAAPAAGGGGSGAAVDELALVQLISMGIDDRKARWALQNTGNDLDRAVDWVFSHDDPPAETEEAPPAATPAAAARPDVTDGAPKYELFGLVSHIGSNAQSGHYVAHVLKAPGQWVIFNDDKVALSQEPPRTRASIYFYRRAQ
jgi:ubiquitin carboxyl-terminal hydrolase 5/13